MQCKNGCGEVALSSGISKKTGKPWRGGKCEVCGVFNFDNTHIKQQPNPQPVNQQPVKNVIVPKEVVKNGEINLAIDRAVEVYCAIHTPEQAMQPEDRIISLAKFFMSLPSDLEITKEEMSLDKLDEELNQI